MPGHPRFRAPTNARRNPLRRSRAADDQTATPLVALQRVRRLSRLLDSALPLPGTSFRIGLDPILGLIPGLGDLLASALSSYIVILALEAGASPWTVTRMIGNIALDSTLGSIPIVGDLFDAVWKSNERNHRLLQANLQTSSTKQADRLVVVLVAMLLIAFMALAFWLGLLMIKWAIGSLSGLVG